MERGSSSFNEPIARNFEPIRPGGVMPEGGGGEGMPLVCEFCLVTQSAGGVQEQVNNVLANIEEQLNAEDGEHSKTSPIPQNFVGPMNVEPVHVSLLSTLEPAKDEKDGEDPTKGEDHEPVANRGKALVLEGDGLNPAPDNGARAI
ncbi:hypothetical protein L1987_20340 [Smallanthus sonchifolius]|uniref:Uncharacterized protein n=1 Tax=Smallanthus sonchifolius TaxID=185202 RepID=A0ACB9ISS0_9ASTR|nr:hypothetical protein L1987_20340 [Smallanthus sonchifolius]